MTADVIMGGKKMRFLTIDGMMTVGPEREMSPCAGECRREMAQALKDAFEYHQFLELDCADIMERDEKVVKLLFGDLVKALKNFQALAKELCPDLTIDFKEHF